MQRPIARPIGETLARLSDSKGIKLVKLAKSANVTLAALSNYKKRIRSMPVATAVRISDEVEDSELNADLAASFFNTLKIAFPRYWKAIYRDDVFAILFQERIEQQQRTSLDEDAFEEMLTGRSDRQFNKWSQEFLEEMAWDMLLYIKACKARGVSSVNQIKKFNEKVG